MRDGSRYVINLPGKFIGCSVDEFCSLFEKCNEAPLDVIVDFSLTVLIDSTAIGILLRSLKDLQRKSKRLILRNLQSGPLNIFKEASLNSLFDIEGDGFEDQSKISHRVTPHLSIQSKRFAQYAVLYLAGSLSGPESMNFLREQVLLQMAEVKNIVLEIEKVIFVDSMAIAELLTIHSLLTDTGAGLYICNANQHVKDLFEMLNISRMISICENTAAAVAKITGATEI
jgi:anti-anti-sigma factor